MNIVKDSDVFSTFESGVMSYMARLYSDLPLGVVADEKLL